MLYVILALIMGFFLGCGVTLYVKKDTKSKYLRRGIYDHQFEATDLLDNKTKIDVQFEVGELEKTSTKSKIEVISVTPNMSEYSTDTYKSRLKSLINHTWISSSDFDWIEDDLAQKRNSKIDEILS